MPRKLPPNVERNVVKGHAYLSFRIGKAWHLPQYGDASTPAGATRFNRKVRQQQRYAKQRAERLAAMTRPDSERRTTPGTEPVARAYGRLFGFF
ncbi:hypothetical protein [Bradyrhizobium diazoefficiens]